MLICYVYIYIYIIAYVSESIETIYKMQYLLTIYHTMHFQYEATP